MKRKPNNIRVLNCQDAAARSSVVVDSDSAIGATNSPFFFYRLAYLEPGSPPLAEWRETALKSIQIDSNDIQKTSKGNELRIFILRHRRIRPRT